ncbi:4Fe-4S binding protein [Candidatus Auribacterota bacterium]
MVFARRLSQILFFILFLILFLLTEDRAGTNELASGARIFFFIDPLIAVGTFLASHKIVAGSLFSLITIFITLLFGRVFCGWICPFGAINQFVGFLRKKASKKVIRETYSKLHRTKYFILIFFLAGSVFGLNQVGLLDPFSFLVRAFSISVMPTLQYAVTAVFDLIFSWNIDSVTNIAGPVMSFLKDNVFYFNPAHFTLFFLISVIFITIVLLNLYRTRFWCRVLCPLGALLGLLSHISFLRLRTNDRCDKCAECLVNCEGACDPHKKDGWIASDCVMCFNCTKDCPEKALEFKFTQRNKQVEPKLDIDRRRVLSAAALGILAVPLLRSAFWNKRVDPSLIRPPGALPEADFLKKCVKCANCMRACPTNFLQPTLFEAGIEGMWSPTGDGRKGYCEYHCTMCGQVCPTEAITDLPLAKKQKVKIGTAFVDTTRCLPYAFNTPCIVCEEHCPTPVKAIWTEKIVVINRYGKKITLQQPHVDPNLCTGCSICANVCPVVDKPAIRVTSVGETRSKNNRFLLT